MPYPLGHTADGSFPSQLIHQSFHQRRLDHFSRSIDCFELKTDTSCIKFVDVDTDHTFFEEIMTLKCMGLVSGNNGKFLPEGSL